MHPREGMVQICPASLSGPGIQSHIHRQTERGRKGKERDKEKKGKEREKRKGRKGKTKGKTTNTHEYGELEIELGPIFRDGVLVVRGSRVTGGIFVSAGFGFVKSALPI